MLLALGFVVEVTNSRERDQLLGLYGLSVFVKGHDCFSFNAPQGVPYLPFYS
jgi:hypothetical protein